MNEKKGRLHKTVRILFIAGGFLFGGCVLCDREHPKGEWTCRCGTVTPLTFGPGNDTEAAWSPDGKRIAFQTDRTGDSDIAAVDLERGTIDSLVEGKGHACYPAWTPDGALIYAFGHHIGTAVQAANEKSNCGYGLRLRRQTGETCVLTQGYWRDYTPAVTADGGAVYYTSTRGNTGTSASLWRLALSPDAAAERVLNLDSDSNGAVQPSLSPDGKILLWAQLDGFRQNWRLCAALATNLCGSVFLTPNEMSAYAPHWSPEGRLIVFTGFREGDSGWGVYLLEPRSGVMARLDTGTGNSRTPAWSPNGKELVFENNRSGFYKLYRMGVTGRMSPAVRSPPAEAGLDRVEARLERRADAAALVGADGSRVTGVVQNNGGVTFERPAGLDFGTNAFFVRVTLTINKHERGTYVAAVGNYAESARGWQVFVNENRKLCFNARDPQGHYVGVESDLPMELEKPVCALGIRDADGDVRLVVDGKMQAGHTSGATLAYGSARKVCLNQREDGGKRSSERVLAFECGRGFPAGVPRLPTRASLFGEVTP
jgi:Tol biopolymer transport system component